MRESTEEEDRAVLIRAALKECGLNQLQFATAIGRDARTVRSWIKGDSIPELPPQDTAQICTILKCSIQELALMFPGESRRVAAIKASHKNR
jgi:DNA-binding XRE family transcriptional regulator